MPDATQNLKLKITADSSQAKQALGGVAGLGAAIAGLTAALYTAKQAYKNFIEPVIAYNKEIKDLSAATGMAVEDLSRFVQVGDDVGVQIGAIDTALKFATKNGFAMTIDSLAALSDETNAMADPTEKAAKLVKIFGRNWSELNPILELGGRRIREMAAATEDGLVVTQEEIDKTEELRLDLDALNDRWLSIRNNLVIGVTPALIQATQRQNFWTAALNMTRKEIEAVDRGIEQDLIPALSELDGFEATPEVDLILMINGHQVSIDLFRAMLNAGTNRRFYSDVTGGSVIPSALSTTPAYSDETEKQRRERTGEALGGQVSGGSSYLVGEHGAERFTPGVSGSLAPANDPLVQEIRRMVRTLPIILRDAVQKS